MPSDASLKLALDSILAAERAIRAAKAALAGDLAGSAGATPTDGETAPAPAFSFTPAPTQDLPDGSKIIEGTFDGRYFVGPDDRKYEINHNYISKSKLVEGDAMKLTITPDGRFIYKQLPEKAPRRHATGTLTFVDGRYQVLVDGKVYNVITSAVTYYKAQPGDELSVILPADREASWATVDNLIAPTFGGSAGPGTTAAADAAARPEPSLAETQKTADALGGAELGEDGDEIKFE